MIIRLVESRKSRHAVDSNLHLHTGLTTSPMEGESCLHCQRRCYATDSHHGHSAAGTATRLLRQLRFHTMPTHWLDARQDVLRQEHGMRRERVTENPQDQRSE